MKDTATHIVAAFQAAGFQAYFAGGCVRDWLMGHEPEDYDIATSAKPEEIEGILLPLEEKLALEEGVKIVPVGKRFGVMLALVNGHAFEVATFRSDSSGSDGRRPDAVLFSDAEADALRRDFTVNGLFYDPIANRIIDHVGGQKDIRGRTLRFIGEPHERIKEDHLRLLRAVRFRNRFDLQYAPSTRQAIADLAHLIDGVSKERVQSELTKMLLHPSRAHAIKELSEFGLLGRLLPELEACRNVRQPVQYHREGDVFTHLLKSLHDMPPPWAIKPLVWALLLHDIGKPQTFSEGADRIHFNHHAELSAQMAQGILRRLKFSRAETVRIVWLIRQHMTVGTIPKMRRAHQITLFLHPWFEDLMRLHWCDEHGSVPIDLGLYRQIMDLYEEFKGQKLLPDHFRPLLNGDEIMALLKTGPGPQIKTLLDSLRHAQMEGEVKSREEAEAFVRSQADPT